MRAPTEHDVEHRRLEAKQVIDIYLREHGPDGPVSRQDIISAHASLMPELGQELRKIELIQRARRSATTGAGGDGPVAAVPSMPPPDSFAGYSLTDEIHRGGQGVVYRARQVSTGQQVAIKVMREGPFAGPRDRARFEREVRILAQLNYPNIVSVIESGSAAGTTFLVMPYISGKPLDRYVADRTLTVDDTMRLFAKVCAAVDVAHLRGVIHRDLKPSNILVDPGGEPHVLDFGLAKVSEFDPIADARSEVATVVGEFVGSLPWASPEQVSGGADESGVDVRTDVYSLGVILYQLLTRQFPYEIMGSRTYVTDQIMTVAPDRPSLFRPGVNDEVDTIVLRCLSKDPQRRYQSAGDLARDVGRYLAREPIEAKRDSGWYVLKTTARRYRVPLTVAGAFVVLMTAFAVNTWFMYRRAVVAEESAQAHARAAIHAEAGLQAIFGKGLSEEMTDRELLSRVAARAVSDVDGDPLARIMLMESVAAICRGLGIFDIESEWRQRIVTAREQIGADDRELAGSLRSLGDALLSSRQHDRAEQTLLQALQRGRNTDSPPGELASTLRLLGSVHHLQSRTQEAESRFREALGVHRAATDGPDREFVITLIRLAEFLNNIGSEHYTEAEKHFREALAMARALDPHDDELVATTLRGLGAALQTQARFEEALVTLDESHALLLGLFPADHPRIAASLDHRGLVHKDMGDYEQAQDLIRQSLQIAIRTQGEAHGSTAYHYLSLAKVHVDAAQWSEAEVPCRRSLELHRQVHPAGQWRVARPMSLLGAILIGQGRYTEAEPLLREALEIRRAGRPPGHWETAKTKSLLGAALTGQKRFEEAEPLLLESYPDIVADRGPHHRRTREAIARIIDLYEAWGRPESAAEWRQAR